ncbi:MAG: hypothetical protein JWO37_2389 [Acidimicrobiales bacterium]|nr:hypothetical protein [Acidimicrobiales bacterium]
MRATFGRRWGGYLALVLLIGLVGGIAMGSIAAARRTQSSYPRFLASTNPSDLNVSAFGANSSPTTASPESTSLTNAIAHLPHVRRVESLVVPIVNPLASNGAPDIRIGAQLAIGGSVDGLLSNQDRVTVIHGRMSDPTRIDEFVMTPAAARVLGAHVGQVVPLGAYTNAQLNAPGFGTPTVTPHLRIDATLVGIVVLDNQVVQDDIDRLPGFVLLTPAATRQVMADSTATLYGLQLDHGGRDVAAAEQAFVDVVPPGSTYEFHVISRVETTVERAVKPEAIAIGVFGAIAALAALFIAVQAISRQLRSGAEDLQVLRALGAGPATTISDGLIGVLAAIVLGSLVAGVVAVGLSPLAPLGPVRAVYPASGIAADWTVLGGGLAVLIVVLGATAVVLASLGAPHRVARRARLVAARRSSVVRVAASSGLSAPGVVGVRFALEPGRGRTAVPVRSALVGTAMAVVMVVATLTFGSSLHTLVSRPALYGWNWDYLLNPSNVVPPQALSALAHDPDVAAWTGVTEFNIPIDGQNVPVLVGDARPALSPPILSGHALAGNDQIVVGAATLGQLHKHVGDTVVVTYGTPVDAPIYLPPTRLTIVGTATMPAAGFTSFVADHPSMGTGALLPVGILPAAFQQATVNPDPALNGPNLVFVRLRPGVSSSAGRADLQRIADAANKAFAADPNGSGSTVSVLGVQHPAEIVNYRSVGTTPVLLASGLAAGAIVALGLTLGASVRRRRPDLALLKTLGFTRRQLASAVAWQASVAAVIGVVVGVPLGIAIGRQLWILFARNIDAVPQPTVPVSSVFLVMFGALVLANLVAAFPGRSAARTPAAQVLRTG